MIKCQKCGFMYDKIDNFKCSNCGNSDPHSFIRIDKEDLNPEEYLTKRDKEWLNNV